MALIGIVMATAMEAWQVYKPVKIRADTAARQESISAAIGRYIAENGRYPCPAGRNLKQGDANFGVSVCPPLVAGSPGYLAPGECGEGAGAHDANRGICRVAGASRSATSIAHPDNVIFGSIPFVTLNLQMTDMLDGYDRRFTYAVSENLTRSELPSIPPGGSLEDIFAVNIYRQVEVKETGSIFVEYGAPHYIDPPTLLQKFDYPYFQNGDDIAVISHGKNGRGAYTLAGEPYGVPCPANNPDSILNDLENCDIDGKFYDTEGVVYETGANENDDRYERDFWDQTNYWSYIIMDNVPNVYNKNAGKVGIGIKEPTLPLEVVGNIRANKANTTQICNYEGTSCFSPSIIGGQGMSCGEGGMMTGIRGGGPVCLSVKDFNLTVIDTDITCPTGQLGVGVDADGQIICALTPL